MNDDKVEDLVGVLRSLGFKAKEARQRVDAVISRHDQVVPLEQLVKEVIAWTQGPSGSLRVRVADSQEVETVKLSASKVPVTQYIWEPEKAEETAAGGAGVGAVLLGILGVLGGAIWFFGAAKVLLVLAAVITVFYAIGKAAA